MAIIGIQPGRQQQQQQRPQSTGSGFDKDLQRVLAALNIANQGFGIAVNFDKLKTQELQQQKLGQEIAAQPTPEQAQTTIATAQKGADLQNQILETQLTGLKDPKPEFKNIQGLRKEWLGNPITKQSQQAQISIEKIANSGQGEPSPAKDHSLVFNYMKMVDPGSTVREGEFATVEKAGGIIDRATVGFFNKTLEGEILTPKQREDFISTAQGLFDKQLQNQQKFDSAFRDLATQSKIDPNQVVLDLGFKSLPQPGQQPGQAQQTGQPSQPPMQFSEDEIDQVMKGAGVSRQEAIIRLRTAAGGGR
jgi:hypothetical protein